MKKEVENEIEDELRPEYDFAQMASSHKPTKYKAVSIRTSGTTPETL
ncbi:MAG: hypothetical protein V7K98_25290 [Nostoc sp.]